MTNDKKNFFWNTIGSTVNSFTSLIFLIIVTRINGINIAGVFTFAFSVACLFQVISNYSGRTFQVTNNDEKIFDSDFVYNRITSCVLMFIVVLFYLLIEGYDLFKTIILLLFVIYRLLESFSDVIYGVIQKNNELYKVGISLFLKGLFGTIIFFILDYFFKNIIVSIIGLIFITLIIMYYYDYKNFKVFYNHNMYDKGKNINLFKLGVFVFGFTFLTQYIINAPKFAIDDYSTNDIQTIYGIISMVATFMSLCSLFVIQPLLVKFADLIKKNKYINLLALSIKTIFYIIIIGIFTLIITYFYGIPILEFIYGFDLKEYLIPLLIIIVGATIYSVAYAISNVLTAMRKTFIQMVFYIICSIIIMFLSKYLVLNYSILGASLSYAITVSVLCCMYVVYYSFYIRRCIKNG